ncbi:MAG: hypothetical protein PVJ74_07070 [Gammaproteobacteria bacterium]
MAWTRGSSSVNGFLILAVIAVIIGVLSRYKSHQKQWKLRQQLRALGTQKRQLF